MLKKLTSVLMLTGALLAGAATLVGCDDDDKTPTDSSVQDSRVDSRTDARTDG